MNLTDLFGRLLGQDKALEFNQVEPSLGAPWARQAPAWLVLGAVALIVVAVLFYTRYQYARRAKARLTLALMRGALLALLLLLLALPELKIHLTHELTPSLWLVFDGTQSMAIDDDLAKDEQDQLNQAVGGFENESEVQPASTAAPRRTRADYLRAFVAKGDENTLAKLQEKFRLRAYLMDRSDGLHLIPSAEKGEKVDPPFVAKAITTNGEVTAIGESLDDLAGRSATDNLAGVVIFSDFNENAGQIPAVEGARRLGVKVYTVGVGATRQVDLAVDLNCPPAMKMEERYALLATVKQSGMADRAVTVKFYSAQQGAAAEAARWKPIGQRPLKLAKDVQTVDLSLRFVPPESKLEKDPQTVDIVYDPKEPGRFAFAAEVEPAAEETVRENNRSEASTTVHDNVMRVLYVEYEPSWEWRFVKEVFHRDKLVGPKGFRTFLCKSSVDVRDDRLFLKELTQGGREKFFANDVIILGDMPNAELSGNPMFCDWVREFVEEFSGGLVVVSGPRYGPGQLAGTDLGDMLPVKVKPDLKIRDAREPFLLKPTREAAAYDFMNIGELDSRPGREHESAWSNLQGLSWGQSVERLHRQGVPLINHPREKCTDGKTPLPLLAIRQYGKGETVYLGFNELWRLRRMHGERYYRAFWGQLIHRLATRHALGEQKRFVIQTDQERYRINDTVYISVIAYDEKFQRLKESWFTERGLKDRRLTGELIGPPLPGSDQPTVRKIDLPLVRDGLFGCQERVERGGEYRIRVHDPVAKLKASSDRNKEEPKRDSLLDEPLPKSKPAQDEAAARDYAEATFPVANVPVERQQAVRNVALQTALADATNGSSYDLTTAARLVDEIRLEPKIETEIQIIKLWNTWLAFALVGLLMLGEWLGRKWVNLP